eukprot:4242236-Amphidinium_carterae.1
MKRRQRFVNLTEILGPRVKVVGKSSTLQENFHFSSGPSSGQAAPSGQNTWQPFSGRYLLEHKFVVLTEIQAKSIPHLLNGKDAAHWPP